MLYQERQTDLFVWEHWGRPDVGSLQCSDLQKKRALPGCGKGNLPHPNYRFSPAVSIHLTALQLLQLTLWEEAGSQTVLQGWSGSLVERTGKLELWWVGLCAWECQDIRNSSFSKSLQVFHQTHEKKSPSLSDWRSKAETQPSTNWKMQKPFAISYSRGVAPFLGYLATLMEDNYSLSHMSDRVTSHPILGTVPC